MPDAMAAATRKLLATPHGFVALYGGAGLAPWMPGTVATVATVPLYLGLARSPWPVYLGIVVLAFAVGVAACNRTTRVLGVHDHRAIVWDEVVGYLITMALVPATPVTVVAGVLLFRVFDVLKPGPIRRLDERVHGGLGIMLDDAAAGLASALCLAAAYYAVPSGS